MTTNPSQQRKGVFLLLTAGLIWGIVWLAMKEGTDSLGAFSFTGIRCFLGGCVILPVAMLFDRRKTPEQKAEENHPRTLVFGSFICALTNILTLILQQTGVAYTSVGKSAFISALYVILVPIFGVFLRKKAPRRIWFCAVLMIVGLYFMSLSGVEITEMNRGDLMMFGAAIGCALQIYVVDHFVGQVDPVKFTSFQFLFTGGICLLVALFVETITLAGIQAAMIPILYAGIVSCGIGYTCQMVGQKYVEPAVVSLLLCSETLFAMIAGFVFYHEILSGREYLGAAMIAAAILLSQLNEKEKKPS